MQTYNSVFRNTLNELISEEIQRLSEILALGFSVNDYPEYKHLVGKIAGLKRALELCEETQTIIDET